jgi:hypothetical protein
MICIRIEHLLPVGVPTKKNEFGRRVLRLAMLSATNDLASRLHQAIILSSEQHATGREYTTTPAHVHYLSPSALQNIFPACAAAQNPEKPGRIDYLINIMIPHGV